MAYGQQGPAAARATVVRFERSLWRTLLTVIVMAAVLVLILVLG